MTHQLEQARDTSRMAGQKIKALSWLLTHNSADVSPDRDCFEGIGLLLAEQGEALVSLATSCDRALVRD